MCSVYKHVSLCSLLSTVYPFIDFYLVSFYLRQRGASRQISLAALLPKSIQHLQLAQAKVIPPRSPTAAARAQPLELSLVSSWGCVLAGSWNQKWSWDLRAITLIQSARVASSLSTTVPNACPLDDIFDSALYPVVWPTSLNNIEGHYVYGKATMNASWVPQSSHLIEFPVLRVAPVAHPKGATAA